MQCDKNMSIYLTFPMIKIFSSKTHTYNYWVLFCLGFFYLQKKKTTEKTKTITAKKPVSPSHHGL